ncbi:MAG TPA: chloride channel protein [Cyclobacteriaceae bacterium]|nr:chloride channel protein [Cyclobacteriaceae bacterium]
MRLIIRAINFIKNRFSEKQFLIISSILVGLTSGLTAVLLKLFVHTISRFVVRYYTTYEKYFLYTFFPLIGIGLTVFIIRRFFKSTFQRGSAEIVYSITKQSSLLPPTQTFSQLITSALTVGFGGSAGLESPMVSAGAGIGSNYARTYNLGYKERTLLLACGSAAGIGAAFNSPIAGVLFAVEVLLTDVTVSAFVPLIIAAASGALLSKVILKEDVLLSFSLQQPFDYHNVPLYIVLGILAGLLSLYYVRTFSFIESKFRLISKSYLKVIVGGLLLSFLLILFPPLYGEGYESIKILSGIHLHELIEGNPLEKLFSSPWMLLLFVSLLMLVKVFATAFTLGSGGNGGNFAPALCVGAYLGFTFSRFINLTGLATIPESNFTLVAMAGILSGIFYAPLTAIFLIVEITGGYGLMIPLMIVAALSNVVAKYFEPLSMEGKKLASKLKLSIDTKDKYLLSRLDFSEMIENDFQCVHSTGMLRDLVTAISKSKRNLYPVVNELNELVGLIQLDDVRSVIFNQELYDKITIKELMTVPKVTIALHESLHDALTKFDSTNLWSLPVINEKKYVGFLSKSSILSKYRSELIKSV